MSPELDAKIVVENNLKALRAVLSDQKREINGLRSALAEKDETFKLQKEALDAQFEDDGKRIKALMETLAEKDAEIERLKLQLDEMKVARDFANAACESRDKRIAELKELDRLNGRYLEQLQQESRDWQETARIHHERLASLQALMERVRHSLVDQFHDPAQDCRPDCPRCAYAKLLEEWK